MRSRLRNKNRTRFLIFTSALLAVVVLGVLFSGVLFRVTSALVFSVSISPNEEYAMLPKNILASRLNDAERELNQVRYQTALYSALVEENQRLTSALGLREPGESGIGRVVSRPPQTHYDTLLVSLKDGHEVLGGDLVLFEGMLIGTAERVSKSAALVSLNTSPGNTLDVRVGSPSAIVVAHGLGGGAFVFDVPNEVVVETGDVVTSAAYDTYFIGIIQSITGDPDKTSKRVHAFSSATLTDVRFVQFVRPINTAELTI